MTDPFFVKAPRRGLIEVEGPERFEFLQRLITNDIYKLKEQPSLYSCLLTPQGKFLHDFFISEGPEVLILDCEGLDRAEDLYERLDKYKMRADVRVSVEPRSQTFICFGVTPRPGYYDPRHEGLGWRSFVKPEDEGVVEEDFAIWDKLRIKLGVPDGSRDAMLEKSTIEELNIDKFKGVSYEKGCFVGQELTARMKHRGLAKKHLYPIAGNDLPDAYEDIKREGNVIGIMRSSCEDTGLAILKDEKKELLDDHQIHLLG